MNLYFLEGKVRLAKEYAKKRKKVVKKPYPFVKEVTSYLEPVSTLEQFKTAIEEHGKRGRCLIKGNLTRELINESRAKSTKTDLMGTTQWFCLDFDYVKNANAATFKKMLSLLGLAGTSFIFQFGAGHKIDKPFSAHLFFMLPRPVKAHNLKLWLMDKNLKIEELSSHCELQPSNVALRWPLDISVAENAKLIYIAPPTCKSFKDPVSQRIRLVTASSDYANIADEIDAMEDDVVEAAKKAKIDELRVQKGLQRRQYKTKTLSNGLDYMPNPGKVQITAMKEERGFVYLNLNGGDSWGYFHPVENPEVIFNFKGEPNYLTKQLAPDYLKHIREQNAQLESDEGNIQYFAFLDRKSDTYYRGAYDPAEKNLELYKTSSVRVINDFYQQVGMMEPQYIEEWDYEFRFDDNRIYVPKEKFVNKFVASPYLKNEFKNVKAEIPSVIEKVIWSAIGEDEEVYEHFINWVSFIIQQRERTQTAWVFNGVQGTGKGLLVNRILKPILGEPYVQTRSLSDLEDLSNEYMEHCVLLMIDESKVTQVQNREKIIAKLKNVITEPMISIRRMRTDSYMVPNYLNVIITSNYPDPIAIEPSDRRFNVGIYQPNRLEINESEFKQIDNELESFAKYLRTRSVNIDAARKVLHNDARKKLQFLTRTSMEVVFDAFLQGDLQFFIDYIPSENIITGDAFASSRVDEYVRILRECESYANHGKTMRLTREEMQIITAVILGELPKSANKYTSTVKHYGITFERKRKKGKLTQCLDIDWKQPEASVDEVTGEDSHLKVVNNE